MGVSHFWSRKHIGTRWEENNLDWCCWLPCHQIWEHEKQGEYQEFMKKKLKEEGYEMLRIKALGITKFSTSELQLMVDNFELLNRNKL